MINKKNHRQLKNYSNLKKTHRYKMYKAKNKLIKSHNEQVIRQKKVKLFI